MKEACDLVQKAILSMPDDVLLPKLEGFCLGDLAQAVGVKKVKITGLPAHEKLHESLAEGYSSDQVLQMTIEHLKLKIDKAAKDE